MNPMYLIPMNYNAKKHALLVLYGLKLSVIDVPLAHRHIPSMTVE